jgi:hypothetical protein
LPDLGQLLICLYDSGTQKGPAAQALRAHLRCAYGNGCLPQGDDDLARSGAVLEHV